MTRHRLPIMFAAAVLLSGCGDTAGPEAVIPAPLVGTWVAEPACLPHCGFTFESVANAGDTINATSFSGITTEVTLTRAGRFTLVFRPGGDGGSSGNARAEDGILIVTDAGGAVDTMDYVVSATTLRLNFRRTFPAFDFNGDGERDPARVRAVLRKR